MDGFNSGAVLNDEVEVAVIVLHAVHEVSLFHLLGDVLAETMVQEVVVQTIVRGVEAVSVSTGIVRGQVGDAGVLQHGNSVGQQRGVDRGHDDRVKVLVDDVLDAVEPCLLVGVGVDVEVLIAGSLHGVAQGVRLRREPCAGELADERDLHNAVSLEVLVVGVVAVIPGVGGVAVLIAGQRIGDERAGIAGSLSVLLAQSFAGGGGSFGSGSVSSGSLGSVRCSGCLGCGGVRCGGLVTGGAGDQSKNHQNRKQKRDQLFHGFSSLIFSPGSSSELRACSSVS